MLQIIGCRAYEDKSVPGSSGQANSFSRVLAASRYPGLLAFSHLNVAFLQNPKMIGTFWAESAADLAARGWRPGGPVRNLREDWCPGQNGVDPADDRARDPALPVVLMNDFPLAREPTRMQYLEFLQWCATEHTADWHVRYGVAAVIYKHLHIPRTTWPEGVRFEEVSLGSPREGQVRAHGPGSPHQILPARETRG